MKRIWLALNFLIAACLATRKGGFISAAARRRSIVVTWSFSSDLYLGIDCGTQGTKAVVYDATRREVVGVGSASHSLITDASRPGLAEQEPSVWEEAMNTACRAAISEASRDSQAAPNVRGIGVSGQQHGLVALDEKYRVLRPAKLWCDTESAEEASYLSERLGWSVVPSYTSSKLLWLKKHEPNIFGKLAHVALPHDYLNMQLTGSLTMECGDASGTGLLDVNKREWDLKAAEMIDATLPDKLPRLIGPNEAAGVLRPEAAAKLGGLRAGIPVSAGSGDNMMSALGCGLTVAGRAAISLGTSGTLFARSSQPAFDPSGAICPFLDATGAALPLLCTLNCASVPEEVRVGYGLDRDELSAAAAAEPVGCEGLSFLPYLRGERSPNWPWASGVLSGIRPGFLARSGLVYRAALEGATFSLKAGVLALQEYALGKAPDEVRLVGGGSKSTLWRKIVADSLQCTVAIPKEAESAALGAALQATALVAGAQEVATFIFEHHDATVIETIEPDPSVADDYESAFELYRSRSHALFANGPGD